MKKRIGFVLILTAAEQAVKILISRLWLNVETVLIPYVFVFHPVQNTYGSYAASLLRLKTPLFVSLLTDTAAFFLVVLIYRYSCFLSEKRRWLLRVYITFMMAGIACALIDIIFWGGSLDYIRLFNWFTFDLKDVYISLSVIALLSFHVLYMPEYSRLSREEQKARDLSQWVKNSLNAMRGKNSKKG